MDIKSLGRIRGIGWEHVHVCIDDYSRLAYAEVLPSACGPDAVPFFERAVAWFAAHGVRATSVMTDNGVTPAPRVRPDGAGTMRQAPQRQARTVGVSVMTAPRAQGGQSVSHRMHESNVDGEERIEGNSGDYDDFRRELYRTTIAGEAPV